jgi:hypothetical protein
MPVPLGLNHRCGRGVTGAELLPLILFSARQDPYAARRRHPRLRRDGTAGQGLLGPVMYR